jgi:hypothetical protein
MPVPESVVEEVVRDFSDQMKEPHFTQAAVGHFVESQPELARFLSIRASRIGGTQGVISAAFHGELMGECLRRHEHRELPQVSFSDLDRASKGDPITTFAAREPALSSYVASNVDDDALRLELSRIGLALSLVLS